MADNNPQFGYSLQLTDGDLVLQVNPGTGLLELAEVSGTDNLMQALILRVQTPYGSDQFNTTYGFDAGAVFTQPQTLSGVQTLIKLNLVRTVGTDPRVSDVQDVQFEDDPAYRARHPEVTDQQVQTDRVERLWPVDVLITVGNGQTTVLSTQVGV